MLAKGSPHLSPVSFWRATESSDGTNRRNTERFVPIELPQCAVDSRRYVLTNE